MKRIFTSKWFWIGVAAFVVLVLVLLFWLAEEFFKPALWAVLIVGVLWILAEVGLRAWQKKKRKAFDEGLTAKEGIEDRRREWQGFQAELDKQKIDRYELPFYLLVGEPQSGKSVLLQNSDLHFPFGQNKLSGIGGTRGCDWWFTEEAVILDLAGRLFTHEGGVADQLEWEAFLDLLASFRPLCPANGILLVVPCDSLLTDSADVAKQKANKIQAALLTLVKKLDAQLPIYLVLTKGDKLFGFAESVHRLDAAKRHEMFGWSRSADKVDSLFDLEEARAGFRETVVRAGLLRAEMLSNAHIPEALGEVDRMYAFPDELAALEEPLEIYLKRVFTDSGLSDRLSFRGIYLTSGLQSGVPIARVCAQALGGGGDADMQELEGLFTKQRAYFIKDLVRTRVFGERGIVRPTKGRVLAAQKRAFVGYGVSALIALFSVIGGMVYLFSDSSAEVDELTTRALDRAHDAERGQDWTLQEHLKVLASIQAAIDQERSTSEEIFNSTRDALKQLYVAEFDHQFAPAMRRALHSKISALVQGEGPQSFEELETAAGACVLMLGNENFASGTARELAETTLPQSEREYAAGQEDPFTLKRALELRGEYSGEPALSPVPPAMAKSLEELAKRTLALADDCLTPGVPYQPINALGYFIAWRGIEQSFLQLTAPGVLNEPKILDLTATYANSWARMELCKTKMDSKTPETWEVKGPLLKGNILPVTGMREPLVKVLAERTGIERPKDDWPALDSLYNFLEVKYASTEKNVDASDLVNVGGLVDKAKQVGLRTLDDELIVPDQKLRGMLDPALEHECRAAPTADWKLDTLGSELDASVRNLSSGDTARNAYVAKVREVGRRFAQRYPTWKSLLDEHSAAGKPLAEDKLAVDWIGKLVQARTALLMLDRNNTREFVAAIEGILVQHFTQLEKGWVDLRPGAAETGVPEIDLTVMDALAAARGTNATFLAGPALSASAQRLAERYVSARQDLMLDHWRTLSDDGEATVEMVTQLDKHFSLMKERFGGPEKDGDDGLDGAWVGEVEAVLVERLERHESLARKYWTPPPLHGQAGLTIGEAARTVLRKLGREEFQELLDGAAEATRPPAFDDPKLARNAQVFEKLERASKALESLRKLRAPPSRGSVLSSAYVEWLKTLADGLSSSAAQDGPALTARVSELDASKRGEQNVPDNAGGVYAKALYDTLRLRMVDELRLRYKADLEKLLEDFSATVDALYAPDFEAAKKLDDTTVMQSLAALLDKGGRFDALAKSYRANDDTLGLIPKDPAVLENEPIWATQRFLTELQTFLLGKDGRKVQDSTAKVSLRPLVNESSSIWDPATGKSWKEAFYYPTTANGDWEFEPVSRDMPEKILAWNFRADKSKKLRMRWNESPSSARTFEPGDVKLEIIGSLAPLLFAWTGEKQENGAWRVVVTPAGSQLPAPFDVRFLDRELPARPIKRPD